MKVRAAVAMALGACGAAAVAAGSADESMSRDTFRQEAIAYEHGEGRPRDQLRAAALYCQAARLGDAEAQYNLGWMYANGRGVERSDVLAAYFFNAAAEQGLDHAVRMLARVGGPPEVVPDCMRPPETADAATDWRMAPVAALFAAKAPKPVVELVEKIAPEFRVHPQLALSIIEAESRFNPAAVSPKNAQGLMQLIPETSARFNVAKPFDPAQNIRGGVAYLRWLLAYFEGDVALVAAAYNAGEGTVNRYRGVPPYAETRAYVQRVLRNVGIDRFPFDARATEASPQLALIRQASRLK